MLYSMVKLVEYQDSLRRFQPGALPVSLSLPTFLNFINEYERGRFVQILFAKLLEQPLAQVVAQQCIY